jgi:hypothetical protein
METTQIREDAQIREPAPELEAGLIDLTGQEASNSNSQENTEEAEVSSFWLFSTTLEGSMLLHQLCALKISKRCWTPGF